MYLDRGPMAGVTCYHEATMTIDVSFGNRNTPKLQLLRYVYLRAKLIYNYLTKVVNMEYPWVIVRFLRLILLAVIAEHICQ